MASSRYSRFLFVRRWIWSSVQSSELSSFTYWKVTPFLCFLIWELISSIKSLFKEDILLGLLLLLVCGFEVPPFSGCVNRLGGVETLVAVVGRYVYQRAVVVARVRRKGDGGPAHLEAGDVVRVSWVTVGRSWNIAAVGCHGHKFCR